MLLNENGSEKQKPKLGSAYYYPIKDRIKGRNYSWKTWRESTFDMNLLNAGRVFLDEADVVKEANRLGF